ncbi:NUDIX domain-containing protein [Rhizobium sp.]|uniref:NUDIX hydrolase n=1 Tax=Rhizobium sp. TaxID=391 RepID=UPI0028B0F88B
MEAYTDQSSTTDVASQAAATFCRYNDRAELEVPLISSLDTGRWVIPKGNLNAKERSFHCAEREAFEEAGVVGNAKKQPVGFYVYLKDRVRPTGVGVHLLRTRSTGQEFTERGARQLTWVHPSIAAGMVAEPQLSQLFGTIAEASPNKRHSVRSVS